MEFGSEKIAKIFKAVDDETRVEIIKLLKTGKKCAYHLSDGLGISQGKLSYHMKILCESGLVKCVYCGKWSVYALNEEGAECALSALQDLLKTREPCKGEPCYDILLEVEAIMGKGI